MQWHTPKNWGVRCAPKKNWHNISSNRAQLYWYGRLCVGLLSVSLGFLLLYNLPHIGCMHVFTFERRWPVSVHIDTLHACFYFWEDSLYCLCSHWEGSLYVASSKFYCFIDLYSSNPTDTSHVLFLRQCSYIYFLHVLISHLL